jgi:hypothetical protein
VHAGACAGKAWGVEWARWVCNGGLRDLRADVMSLAAGKDAQAGEEGMHDV